MGLNNLVPLLLKNTDFKDYYKLTDFFCLDLKRIESDYDVRVVDYFPNNVIAETIVGPVLGLETKKVSLSAAYKNLCSANSNGRGFGKLNDTLLTNLPTSTVVFDEWEKYLKKKGVKIYTNTQVTDVNIKDKNIMNIIINGHTITADEYIFASSLKFTNNLFKHKYSCLTFEKMKGLEHDLQLYFSINMYFNKEISTKSCETFIILNSSWQPIVQRKITWGKGVLDKCSINKKKINEVWNVGFLDFYPGKYTTNKILSECSLEEAIHEGVTQVKENEYIQKMLKDLGLSFDDIYIGHENWYQYKNNNNGKLFTENPKFSVNVNTTKNMPKSHEDDIPNNMSLAGYYTSNTMGGVSMEASCETGLNAGKHIIDKYNLPYNDVYPIKHEDTILSNYTYPVILIDKLLFNLELPSIFKYVNSFYFLLLYFIILFFIVIYLIYKSSMLLYLITKNKKIKSFLKM